MSGREKSTKMRKKAEKIEKNHEIKKETGKGERILSMWAFYGGYYEYPGTS